MEQRLLSLRSGSLHARSKPNSPNRIFRVGFHHLMKNKTHLGSFPSSILALNIKTKKKERKGFSHCRLPSSTWQCFSL